MSETLTDSGGNVVGVSIPFTQYVLPNGNRKHTEIARTPEIAELAERFISAGGKYECEILTTGHASLTACFDDPEHGWQDIVIEVVRNGPDVPPTVDRIVRKSVEYLDSLHEAAQ